MGILDLSCTGCWFVLEDRAMTDIEIENIRVELMNTYRGCSITISEDRREMIAEVSNGYAVAVIERSVPHFHLKMSEIYRILRGTLYVSSGGKGYVLHKGDTMIIEPGLVHFARGDGVPAWIEVESMPPWSPDDHFVL